MTTTAMRNVPWIHISVGYTTLRKKGQIPTSDDIKAMKTAQDTIKRVFRQDPNHPRWLTPNTTQVPENLPVELSWLDDSWSKQVLQIEVWRVLAETGATDNPDLVVTRLVALVDKSGHPGTRCQLVGDKWYNSRSYLLDEDGKPWLSNDNLFTHITLIWLCPGPKNEGKPPTAKAARNRDAGKPRGASGSTATTKAKRAKP